jgi:hypothetical protein
VEPTTGVLPLISRLPADSSLVPPIVVEEEAVVIAATADIVLAAHPVAHHK